MNAALTPPQRALLGYMEGASEARWAAGWLVSLHESLKGDEAYDWLVEQAGGTFVHGSEAKPGAEVQNCNGRMLAFVKVESL